MDLEFWLNATPQERLRGVTELIGQLVGWQEQVDLPPTSKSCWRNSPATRLSS